MKDELREAAMSRRGTAQVVLLPRDPEAGYVYWEWPDGPKHGESGRLTLYLQGEAQRHEIASFEIQEECGGRFVQFERPGALHVCELQWGEESLDSAPLKAPRRESGDDKPKFVRVELSQRGLDTKPAEHEHAVYGRFPAASISAPSSRGSLQE